MKKEELIMYLKENNVEIKGLNRMRKHDLQMMKEKKERENNDLIRRMKEISSHNIDPITLELFEEWNYNELVECIFLNGYYYKKSSLQKYIEEECKKSNSTLIKDPVNRQLILPTFLIDKFQIQLQKDNIEIRCNTFTTIVYEEIEIIGIYIDIISDDDMKIESTLSMIGNKRFFIGFIPGNIEINNQTMFSSLDTMSTSNSLLARIVDLYTNKKKMIVFDEENKKIIINPIHSINSVNFNNWFILDQDCEFETIDLQSKNSIYMRLIEELDFIERS